MAKLIHASVNLSYQDTNSRFTQSTRSMELKRTLFAPLILEFRPHPPVAASSFRAAWWLQLTEAIIRIGGLSLLSIHSKVSLAWSSYDRITSEAFIPCRLVNVARLSPDWFFIIDIRVGLNLVFRLQMTGKLLFVTNELVLNAIRVYLFDLKWAVIIIQVVVSNKLVE